MGLISAGLNAIGGTLASQWKEYFYCDSLPANVLVTKAMKQTKGRFGGSKKEDDNVISAGSVIADVNSVKIASSATPPLAQRWTAELCARQ